MEYLIGIGLAVVVCLFATLVGFDRDRVFYPTLVTVIATYYILFAAIGSSTQVLALESLIAGAFLVLAVGRVQEESVGDCGCPRRTRSCRLFSSRVHSESRCAPWLPGFCLSFDVLAAAFLAILLMRPFGFASKV
jgi:hypothetical protein